jgi:hypothetical protein
VRENDSRMEVAECKITNGNGASKDTSGTTGIVSNEMPLILDGSKAASS